MVSKNYSLENGSAGGIFNEQNAFGQDFVNGNSIEGKLT